MIQRTAAPSMKGTRPHQQPPRPPRSRIARAGAVGHRDGKDYTEPVAAQVKRSPSRRNNTAPRSTCGARETLPDGIEAVFDLQVRRMVWLASWVMARGSPLIIALIRPVLRRKRRESVSF